MKSKQIMRSFYMCDMVKIENHIAINFNELAYIIHICYDFKTGKNKKSNKKLIQRKNGNKS